MTLSDAIEEYRRGTRLAPWLGRFQQAAILDQSVMEASGQRLLETCARRLIRSARFPIGDGARENGANTIVQVK